MYGIFKWVGQNINILKVELDFNQAFVMKAQ